MIPLRDENPTRTFPVITILFIVINAAVFFYQMSLGPHMEQFVASFAAVPSHVAHWQNPPGLVAFPPLVTLLTSMFLHGGFLHIAGNMLFLWIFGNNIEDYVGHFSFIFFYLVCGVAAGLLQVFMTPDSTIPLVGASGAISGVMGAYVVLYPRAKIQTLVFLGFFIRIVRIPAYFFLFFWFLIQLLSALYSSNAPDQGGVAFFAHIGGFVAGILMILFWQNSKKIYYS
jgi:membrane associated rhomboid family serine protease